MLSQKKYHLGNIYDLPVTYDAIDKTKILNIHK